MTECSSCHTVPPTPHTDYCAVVRAPWLGHRDACSLQWSDECDCPNGEYHLGWNAALREVLAMSKVRGYQAAVEWARGQRPELSGGVPHG